MKLALWLLTVPVFASPCILQLPGEDYTSTGCATFDTTPVLGQWVPNPNDYVEVDWTCVENERYFVDSVPEYQHYDGAPSCNPETVLLTPPGTYTPPLDTIPVPEPATWKLLGVVLVVGFFWWLLNGEI